MSHHNYWVDLIRPGTEIPSSQFGKKLTIWSLLLHRKWTSLSPDAFKALIPTFKSIFAKGVAKFFDEVPGIRFMISFKDTRGQDTITLCLKNWVRENDKLWPQKLCLENVHKFSEWIVESLCAADYDDGFEIEKQIMRKSPSDLNRFRYVLPPWRRASEKQSRHDHALDECYDVPALVAEEAQSWYCVPFWDHEDVLVKAPFTAKMGRWNFGSGHSTEAFYRKKFYAVHKEILERHEAWSALPCFLLRNMGEPMSKADMNVVEEKLRDFLEEGVKFLETERTIAARAGLDYIFWGNATLREVVMSFTWLPAKVSSFHPPFTGSCEMLIYELMEDSRKVLEELESLIEKFCESYEDADIEPCWISSPSKTHRARVEKLLQSKAKSTTLGVHQRSRKRIKRVGLLDSSDSD